MRLLIATDHCFMRHRSGVYDRFNVSRRSFDDFLAVFESVTTLARVRPVAELPDHAQRSDGDGVKFVDIPDDHGLEWVIKAPLVASRVACAAVEAADAVIVRGNSRIGGMAAWAARRQGKPYLLEVLGDPSIALPAIGAGFQYKLLARYETFRLKRLIAHADLICYVDKDHLPKAYPPPAERMSVCLSDIRLEDGDYGAPRAYAGPLVRPRLLQVASLYPYKRHGDLFEAARLLRDQGLDFELHLAGDGPSREELERQARTLGLSDRTVFHGHVSSRGRLLELMDAADLAVITSASEGLPRVALEKMARGLPVIGTRTSGVAELVRPEDQYQVGAVKELAQIITQVVNDPERLGAMSRYSFQLATEYSNRKLSPRRIELLTSLRDQAQLKKAARAGAGTAQRREEGEGANPRIKESQMPALLKELHHQLRWALPIWFMYILTTWWPNNRITARVRGAFHRPFIKKCGKNLQLASGVRLLNPQNLELGDDVYLAYYVWLNALGGLTIEDEVVMGPFVTISTLAHCYKDGSFRHGGAKAAPVKVGKGSFLAAHSSVTAGVSVGKGCLVGANSVVNRDVPDGKLVGGVPAKIICDCSERDPDIMSRSGFQPGW